MDLQVIITPLIGLVGVIIGGLLSGFAKLKETDVYKDSQGKSVGTPVMEYSLPLTL